MRWVILWVMIVTGLAPVIQAQGFDRRAMLDNIATNIIEPQHEAFFAEALALQSAIHTLQADLNLQNLTTAQAAWKRAAYEWAKCELFSSQRIMLLHNQINKWETNTHFIENFIAGDEELDSAFIETIGSTAKGLPAIEYLIFEPAQDNAAVLDQLASNTRRLDYLVALADNLIFKTEELLNVWSRAGVKYLETFITADGEGNNSQSTISRLTNEMVVYLDDILNRRLEIPLGRNTGGTIQPESLQAWRSGYSAALIQSRLEGFQWAFNGGEGIGFDDYLDFLGATYEGEPLSAVINQRVERVLGTLERLEAPLYQLLAQDPEQVRTLTAQVRNLFILVRVDMVSWLGVTLTFTDRDGD